MRCICRSAGNRCSVIFTRVFGWSICGIFLGIYFFFNLALQLCQNSLCTFGFVRFTLMLISLSRQTKFNSIRFGCEHNASESQPHSTMLRVQLKSVARSQTRASQSVELALSLSQSVSLVFTLWAQIELSNSRQGSGLSLSHSLSQLAWVPGRCCCPLSLPLSPSPSRALSLVSVGVCASACVWVAWSLFAELWATLPGRTSSTVCCCCCCCCC